MSLFRRAKASLGVFILVWVKVGDQSRKGTVMFGLSRPLLALLCWFQCCRAVNQEGRPGLFGTVKASFGAIMLFLVYGGGQSRGDTVCFCLIRASFVVKRWDWCRGRSVMRENHSLFRLVKAYFGGQS